MTEERIQNENGPIEPNKTEIHVLVETEIKNDERLIYDEFKALMIRNETEEYLPLKKVSQRKLKDETKKVNELLRQTGTDDITQINKLALAAALWVVKKLA